MDSCYLLVDKKGSNPVVQHLFKGLKGQSRPCFIVWHSFKKAIGFVYKIEEESYRDIPSLEVRSFFTSQELFKELGTYLSQYQVYVDFDFISHKLFLNLQNLGIPLFSAKGLRQTIFCPTNEQIETHIEANRKIDRIIEEFTGWFSTHQELSERQIVDWLKKKIEISGMETVGEPIVAFKENSSFPHYHPVEEGKMIARDGPLLIDLWAKLKKPGSIFADRTFMFMVNRQPNSKELEVFETVLLAQKKGFDSIGFGVKGGEVDLTSRRILADRGYEKNIYHRLGHSIDMELHGMSMHLDGVEDPEELTFIPNLIFSLEPAIYLPNEFGVRLESNIVIGEDGKPQWTCPLQERWICLKTKRETNDYER
jgi:Xaa-Pro aminopeptidase